MQMQLLYILYIDLVGHNPQNNYKKYEKNKKFCMFKYKVLKIIRRNVEFG